MVYGKNCNLSYLSTVEVTCAHHLVIDDDIYALLPVPLFALSVVDHWHIDDLESLWTETGTGLQGTPSTGPPVVAHQMHVLWWEADGRNVRSVLHVPVQPYHRHVVAVGLRCELEVRVDFD